MSDQKLVNWNIHGHFHKNSSHDGISSEHTDRYYGSTYFNAHKEKYILVQIEDSLSPIALEAVIGSVGK